MRLVTVLESCAALFLVLVLVQPLLAATWTVDPSGGGDATTVAGGLALAAYGDSVLVRAGTYYEHLTMKNGVVLRSVAGPDFTTINGSDTGSILNCHGVDATSAIEGFTLTHARGDSVGGAIVCLAHSSPRIADNVITFNRSRYGAAVGCADNSSPVVENNLITDNTANEECGGVLGLNHCDLLVENNRFERNVSLSRSGGAMWFGAQCRVTVRGNHVTDNSCHDGGGGVWLGNTTSGTMVIEDNLFARNSCGIHGGAIYGGNVQVAIRNNTIDRCSAVTEGGGIWIWTGASVMENNIVSRCNVGAMGTEGAAILECNDLWNNPDGHYAGTIIPGVDDIHADPLYCDDLVDDYRLSAGSPALNPPGCGRMGAFGQGCGATATENTTWGAVKERFR